MPPVLFFSPMTATIEATEVDGGNTMLKLKRIIEEHDTKSGRTFDLLIQFLIVVSLAAFSVETLPSLSDPMRKLLHVIEFVTVAIFTGEYVL